MYEELVKRLRRCEQFRCRECEYEKINGCRSKLNKEAADAIEKLQAYADLYRDGGETAMRVVEQYNARIEELQKQLQKSEADNVNLTGWLAEEHANNCPHYIRNVHDRGDDSLCDKFKCEVNALPKWIPVTERLPDKPGIYAVWTAKGFGNHLSTSYFDGDSWSLRITHWMPLPEPPKEESYGV